jgi:hypothetical protein
VARVPALSMEIVKQSHDTKGFLVLPGFDTHDIKEAKTLLDELSAW